MSWEFKRLADICDIRLGKTPSRNEKSYWDAEKVGSNIWVSIADLTKLKTRFISDSKEYISNKGAALFNPVKAGTLLMSFKLSIGKLAYAECDLYTNEAIVALPIKDRSQLSSEFLYYYLQFYDWDKETENDVKLKGKTLNKAKLNEIKVPLPSLARQQKIVAKLDAIFAEIDKATVAAEANAKNAEALFQSYLTQIFENDLSEYVERSIDEITLKTKNISPDKNPLEEFSYVDVSSVSNESFKIVSTQKILGKEAPSRAKKHILENDILFATVRPTLKRIALVPSKLSNQVASTGYVVLRASKDALPKFIFYFLFSNNFMEQMNKLQKGASYPAVTDSDVKSQRLRVPPLDVQKIVTEKIDALFERCSLISKINQSRVIELAAIKKSILNKAFSGELVKD